MISRTALSQHSLLFWGLDALFLLMPMLLVPFVLVQVLAAAHLVQWPFWVPLASGGLYLLAQGLRAVRLATIAGPLLGMSGRTSCLLHVVTVPGAMVLPFKLGEMIRLQQLWALTRNFPGAVTVVLLERTFDAVMLLFLLLFLRQSSVETAQAEDWLWGLTILAVTMAATVFILGPQALATIQSYIVRNHRKRGSLRQLSRIDRMRQLTGDAAQVLRRQGMLLGVMSAMIWGLELAAIALLAAFATTPPLQDSAALLVTRILYDSAALLRQSEAPLLLASAGITLLVMALIWLPAIAVYARRRRHEPIRRGLPSTTQTRKLAHGT